MMTKQETLQTGRFVVLGLLAAIAGTVAGIGLFVFALYAWTVLVG